jgi:hypothetical protein
VHCPHRRPSGILICRISSHIEQYNSTSCDPGDGSASSGLRFRDSTEPKEALVTLVST